MKLAFLYGRFSLGNRPFDFDRLYTDRRGLTGSEISCIEYALAMKDRGHDVTLIVGQPMLPIQWRGITVRQLDNPKAVEGCDAVLSWNEPDLFPEIAPGPLRVMNQQLNDFAYCKPNWWEHVDIVTSPSERHLEFLKSQAPGVKQWAVLPNGCDPSQYGRNPKVPGRVIWASSADRGLHLLLQMWPEIKRRVPHASLRCFYNYQPAHFDDYEQTGPNVHPDLLEIAQRKRYIEHAVAKLSDPRWDVQHVGSVGRTRMRLEFDQAEVLAYCCDTIRFTEGFSVTTLEACASRTLPIITGVDALGQIYGDAAVTVAPIHAEIDGKRFETWTDHFADQVVRGLTDEAWREERVSKCSEFAAKHAWPALAASLESMLVNARGKSKCGAGRPQSGISRTSPIIWGEEVTNAG